MILYILDSQEKLALNYYLTMYYYQKNEDSLKYYM